jgi:hypothetical protein
MQQVVRWTQSVSHTAAALQRGASVYSMMTHCISNASCKDKYMHTSLRCVLLASKHHFMLAYICIIKSSGAVTFADNSTSSNYMLQQLRSY